MTTATPDKAGQPVDPKLAQTLDFMTGGSGIYASIEALHQANVVMAGQIAAIVSLLISKGLVTGPEILEAIKLHKAKLQARESEQSKPDAGDQAPKEPA